MYSVRARDDRSKNARYTVAAGDRTLTPVRGRPSDPARRREGRGNRSPRGAAFPLAGRRTGGGEGGRVRRRRRRYGVSQLRRANEPVIYTANYVIYYIVKHGASLRYFCSLKNKYNFFINERYRGKNAVTTALRASHRNCIRTFVIYIYYPKATMQFE